jgi:predicted ATPase
VDGYRFIHSLTLKNFLSYGSEETTIELEPLNVIIGPNASGKSNLIEALNLVSALPRDIHRPIREGDGIHEWLWKGEAANPVAGMEIVIDFPHGEWPLCYGLDFTEARQKFEIVKEQVKSFDRRNGRDSYFYSYVDGVASLFRNLDEDLIPGDSRNRQRNTIEIAHNRSVFTEIKDRSQYPELNYLSEKFSGIKIYRELNLGRSSPMRRPQKPDSPEDFLLEDASNLGLVVNNLEPRLGRRFLAEKLQAINENVEEIYTNIQGGTVQLLLQERWLREPIPATRLSDGTLRYLCLLTILCHPDPPPLICIEEPELGLHPDVMQSLAKLLIAASQKTQLIITTHSDVLVSALSEFPEVVIVCEKDSAGSHLQRLDPKRLNDWLENYSLGEIWLMGEIGAKRW